MKKVLCICTANMTRSPACEDILNASKRYEAKSAGIGDNAIVHVTKELVEWADIIIIITACERTDKHLTYLKDHFDLTGKELYDLDIPDFIYSSRYDPELIDLLRKKLKKSFTL